MNQVIEIFLVSIIQLVWTMHNICKVRGSNPATTKKKINDKLVVFFLKRKKKSYQNQRKKDENLFQCGSLDKLHKNN